MTEEWKIDLYPTECLEKIFKFAQGNHSFEASYIVEDWQQGKYDNVRFNDFFCNEGVYHNFICLVFETDKSMRTERELSREETERLQELEYMLLRDERIDEFQIKQIINEIHEIAPGKYVYVIFSTTDKSYIPIFIDRENYWTRLDTFPLTEGWPREKPDVRKRKEFNIRTFKGELPEKEPHFVEIKTEFAGRHAGTLTKQGLRIEMDIKGKVLNLKVEMRHFNQELIVAELFISKLKVVRTRIITDKSAKGITFQFPPFYF